MYNLYTNSIVSVRSRACLSLSLNDTPSYSHLPNGGYPSSSPGCTCCCCPSISPLTSCRVFPLNPSPQFIPFSCRRRVILVVSGGGRCDVDGGREEGRKSKGKGVALLGRRRVYGGTGEDAEAMISLLTDQLGHQSKLGRKGCRRRVEREDHLKRGSTASSYYSCSDSGVSDHEFVQQSVMETTKGFGGRATTATSSEQVNKNFEKLDHREVDAVSSCGFGTTCSGNQTRSDSEQKPHFESGQVNFHNTDRRYSSTAWQQSGNRVSTQEERSALLQENVVAPSPAAFMSKTHKHSNVLDGQQEEEARLAVLEKNSSFISAQHAKGKHYQTVAQISCQNRSRNESKDVSASRNQTCFTERIQSAEERIEMREHVNERVKQTDHRPRRAASFHTSSAGDDRQVKRSLLSPKSSPPPLSIERDHVYVEPAISFTGQYSASPGGQAQAYGTDNGPSHLVSHVDLLDSAEQMDRSSLQVIDAFVEKALNAASTSVTHMENKMPGRQLVNEGVTRTHDDSTQGTVSESAATPLSVVDRTSGRSLWNVLADIVLFRWGQPAESQKSPVKSGGRSSWSDSPSSEAWFSGNDLDESQDSDRKLKISSTPQELTSVDQPLVIRTPTKSSREGLTVLKTGYGARSAMDSDPSSSGGGISAERNLELDVDERTSQVTSSMDWSQPAAGLLRRSHRRSLATLGLREGGKQAIASGRVDQIKDDLDSTPTEISGSEDHEVELKQGKLLRNKQVMRETFDEWEEAYRLETEQRKIDEVFMREALGEARKAADRWEVPVGAVLVRDGKIIARGYNLVEDLRDCTAHAEMVCIREASKILQTWRLSDTTLYVTLEPCAMCAGAILQARTGTLVYGAPNKLLGADGSWIRVFPSSSGGMDREGGSESMGKGEGPVHPFHQKMKIRRGILEAECADVMQQFFRLRRKTDKKTEQECSKKLLVQPSRLLQKMHHVFHLLFCC